MPPKKSLGSSARTASARPKRLPGIKYKPTAQVSNFDDSDSESDADINNGNHVKLSQTILGSHNSLKQLLSAPNSSQQEPSTPIVPKPRKRRQNQANGAESPLRESTTPLSRLKNAKALLASLPDRKRQSIHFEDIEALQPPKKRGPRRANRVLESPDSPAKPLKPLPKPRGKRNSAKRQALSENTGSNGLPKVEQLRKLENDFNLLSEQIPKRRSSYSNRGKRVSSIGNGYVAKPHSEVATSEFYKSLDTSLPEPSQVRQLLVWCFRKKLEEEEAEDESASADPAKGIAKIIKEELLKDLVKGTISTSWYSRRDEDDNAGLSGKRIVKPNAQNESNKENVEIFTRKLKQLQAEKQEWHNSFNTAVGQLLGLSVGNVKMEKLQIQALSKSSEEKYTENVLNETLILKLEESASEVQSHVPQSLEQSVDRLYHVLYQMDQAVKLAAKVKQDRLQAQVAQVVQKFLGQGQTQPTHIGCKELLRGISRLDAPKQKGSGPKS